MFDYCELICVFVGHRFGCFVGFMRLVVGVLRWLLFLLLLSLGVNSVGDATVYLCAAV